ncbi:MAG: hypothetical protein HY870_16225 [Chloroflexi bacterium]|nr:hypothetical protein [Chloroflexota bacterium]
MKRLILALFIFGLILGVAYAWFIDPIHLTDASPAQVTEAYRHVWIMLAAEALAQDGSWERTRARLDTLRDPALPQTVKTLFEQIDAQESRSAARALAQLADRLGARTAEMSVYLVTPAITPSPKPSPSATPATASVLSTPRPTTPITAATITATARAVTPMPVPTYNPSYQIVSQIAECTRPPAMPQIRVTVQDAAGQGVAGVTVGITWDGGDDRFVTGLKPEINAGYGDFDMLRDRTYNVSIEQRESVIASGLQAEACAGGGFVSWRMIIRQTAR